MKTACGLFIAVVALAGCFSPKYGSGHLKCENGGTCPNDFHCAANGTCWKNGTDPELDLAVTLTDAGAVDLQSTTDGPAVTGDLAGLVLHKGEACQPGDNCETGHCVDGYCCESACTGSCQACNQPGLLGTCANVGAAAVPVGSRTCNAQAASTCNLDGKCDGMGACRNWPAGTVCVPGTCALVAGGGKAAGDFVDPSTCDGIGNCVANSSGNCAPYVCQDATQCYSSCSGGSNLECSGTNTCVAGSCGQLPNGRTCMNGGSCLSGKCVDGYCCNDVCTSPCQACNVSGSFGICSTVLKNTTPKAPGCGSDVNCAGGCDGNVATCAYPGGSKQCGSGCSSSQFQAKACDGNGACAPLSPSPCPSHFSCVGSGCIGSCNGSSDCVSGYGCTPAKACAKICVWNSDNWDDGCICQ